MTTPLSMTVQSIKSIDDSTEVGADEPYILVTAADLSGPVPSLEVTLYGPWPGVDKGETAPTLPVPPIGIDVLNLSRRPFWPFNGKNADTISKIDNLIFIVSVMENDDGNPNTLRTLVKLAALGSLAASTGIGRKTRVDKLIADINGALGTPTGAPNFDDIVGTQELVLTNKDLTPHRSKKNVRTLKFNGKDEGTFEVAIEIDFHG